MIKLLGKKILTFLMLFLGDRGVVRSIISLTGPLFAEYLIYMRDFFNVYLRKCDFNLH